VKVHIKAIAERYIIDGETADGALMFLPSEAVYAELHAKLPEVVRAGFDARVWIVSPTTCMATLNTMRAVMKDARMREQAGEIRKALRQLHRDVEIIENVPESSKPILRQAGEDVSGLLTASARAGKRAERLDHFDFEELSPDMWARLPASCPCSAVMCQFSYENSPSPCARAARRDTCFLTEKTRAACPYGAHGSSLSR
jgi:DNA recombination protein RmuC